MKRGFILASLAIAAVVTASSAAADQPRATDPMFSALPTGKVTSPPSAKAPGSIPAREKVAGFFPVVPSGQGPKTSYFVIASSEKLAKQMREGSGFGNDQTGCFSEDDVRGDGDGEPKEWRSQLQPMVTISVDRERGGGTVQAIHLERIIEDGGRVALEMIDAWVDRQTRGARLIGRSTLPLALVKTVLGGGRVFAARDRDNVQLVFIEPQAEVRFGRQPLMATVPGGGMAMSSCGHIRVPLKVEKGQGEAVTIMATLPLPSLEPRDHTQAKSASKSESTEGRDEARARPMHVHASVSWVSRDKEPIVSVSMGWEGRERTTSSRDMDRD